MKKLLIIVSLMLVMSTLVSCAGQTVPTASEITNVVPSAATSETTETSEPASTTSQPVVTPPYIVSEPAMISDRAPFSNQIIETEDKIFPREILYGGIVWKSLRVLQQIDGKCTCSATIRTATTRIRRTKSSRRMRRGPDMRSVYSFEVSPLIYFP
jgi:hypothetical protein